MATITEAELYTQSTYRLCLNTMSRPGTIGQLNPPANVPGLSVVSPYLAGLALTLLDHEVSFHIHQGTERDYAWVEFRTLSGRAGAGECDYLFTDGGKRFAVGELKRGSLQSPDRSCTVICQVRQLGDSPVAGGPAVRLCLRGPGIREETTVVIAGLDASNVAAWQEVNGEFPLGVDWIFVDDSGCICAVPRSSRFEWETLAPVAREGEDSYGH